MEDIWKILCKMDHGACNIIYLDRRAQAETYRRDSVFLKRASDAGLRDEEYFEQKPQLSPELQSNVESILSTFNEGKFIGLAALYSCSLSSANSVI